MSTISVVIPTFNDARFLEVALAAVAAQVRPADEVIVVDNASTDDTASVARSAGATIVYEPVQGIWPAASTGYDAATGDVIARLDADSVPPPDWLLRIEATLEADPGIGVLTGPGDFYGCSALVAQLGETVYMGGYLWAMRLWLRQPPIFGSNFAMRRAVWLETRDRVHRTMDDVHDDLDLSIHLDQSVTVVWEPTLRVGISARPFYTWNGMARRLRWAGHTIFMHWPEESPWRRRTTRRARAKRPETDGLTRRTV